MIRSLLAVASLLACVMPSAAHVTLESQEARIGASYKAVVRVPHGCEGTPTTAIRVRIPEGVLGVKPMPKPGWTLTTNIKPYEKPYQLYHRQISEGVVEIGWSGGKLLDDWYEEFVFQVFLSEELDSTRPVYFPVVQECEKGAHRWIEIPTPGKTSSDYREPAPALKLLPRAGPRN